MNTSRIAPLVVALVIAVATAPVRGSGTARAGRVVLTSEELQNTVITRIGDILLLIDGWTVNTTDGYTWRASVNGLSPAQGEGWIVMLDGQPVEPDVVTGRNINAIPLDPGCIDSVEVVNRPCIRHGIFTERGLVHIHTSRPSAGTALRASAMFGDETGDPGPYKYTEHGTPNNERIGRRGSVSLEHGRRRLYFRTVLNFQDHTFSDPGMRQRVASCISDEWANMNLVSASMKAGIEGSRVNGEIYMSRCEAEKYFIFFQPFGCEIPVTSISNHIGARGDIGIGNNDDIDFRFAYASSRQKRFENNPGIEFEGTWKHLLGALSYGSSHGDFIFNGGAGFDRHRLDSRDRFQDGSCTIFSVFGCLERTGVAPGRQEAQVMMRFTGENAALKVSAGHDMQVGGGSSVHAHISFSQRLFEEENSIWYWIGRGYSLLDNYGVEYDVNGPLRRSTQITADLTWEAGAGNPWSLAVTGAHRYFGDILLERQDLDLDESRCTFSGPLSVRTGEHGHIGIGSVTIRYFPSNRMSHRLFFSFRKTLGGSDLFGDVWRSVPGRTAAYTVTWNPVENLSLGSRLSYRSSSYWIDYKGIDGRSCAAPEGITYRADVPYALVADIQVRKWFSRRRIAGSFMVRNLWNGEKRYHPAGASFDLSFFVQLDAHFGGL